MRSSRPSRSNRVFKMWDPSAPVDHCISCNESMPLAKKSEVGELTLHFTMTSPRLTAAITSSIARGSTCASGIQLVPCSLSSSYRESILGLKATSVLCRCTVPLPALKNGTDAGAIRILVFDTLACLGQRLLHSSTVGHILSTSSCLAFSESICLSVGSTRSAASWRC